MEIWLSGENLEFPGNFEFWRKSRISAKISASGENLEFRWKFRILAKIGGFQGKTLRQGRRLNVELGKTNR